MGVAIEDARRREDESSLKQYSKWFIRVAALYGLLGAILGSHVAGSQDYNYVPAHGHVLVVGWLTLFAYGVFYHVFPIPGMRKIASVHSVLALIGGATMPLFMLVYYLERNPLTTGLFISSASILLVAMILFVIIVCFDKKVFAGQK